GLPSLSRKTRVSNMLMSTFMEDMPPCFCGSMVEASTDCATMSVVSSASAKACVMPSVQSSVSSRNIERIRFMGVLLSLRYFKRLTPLVLSGILPFFGLFGVFPVAPKLFQAGVERIAGNAEEFAHPFAALGNQKRAVG